MMNSRLGAFMIVVILHVGNVTIGCKKTPDPPPKPRCQLPLVSKQVTDIGGSLICSGYEDPYYNVPKTSEDISLQHVAKGGVLENGTLVFKAELALPTQDPESSLCHLICPPGYTPAPASKSSCDSSIWALDSSSNTWSHDPTDSIWSHDPSTMFCKPSPCGVPTAPQHGKYSCYGSPYICYLTCDPGYATMAKTTITCKNGSWDRDPTSIQCEVAVALMIGGSGPDRKKPFWHDTSQTMEVFSPVDEECSSAFLPLLPMGEFKHTSDLLNGEIISCGGIDIGYRNQYNKTEQRQTCFKLMDNNTWAVHSILPGYGRMYHMSAVQLGQLQLIGNLHEPKAPVLVFQNEKWVTGREPSLPPTVWPSYISKPCTVETSPTTYIVTGGSFDFMSEKFVTVMEFNRLTKEWRNLPSLPEGRYDQACALVTTKNGPAVMVAGGKNMYISDYQLESVYLLDLAAEMWYPAGTLNRGRENMELVVLGERVLILGSSSFDKDGFTMEEETVEEYIVPCPSLRECSPSQQGTWNLTERVIGRRSGLTVVPVPASRFNCTG